ncbi:FAD-binding oxidoreductase [Allobranchiibius sp. CTAmp26]|nr:FAD-binding oxidoreductase [Allobranchiibius sp. CTAmp26]
MRDDVPVDELVTRLTASGIEAHADPLTRSLYTSDASLYRIAPAAVAFPRSSEQVEQAYAVARDLGVPLTTRGAGTSIAGNSIGAGLVLDFSRHLDQVLHIDPEARTAVVQPGVVQARLQSAASPHGLRFGPDPSTSTRCTIGGMLGNNACGSRTLGYGRTVDNVVALKGFWGTGDRFDLTSGTRSTGPVAQQLTGLGAENLELIRTSFARFGRQVSGYSMEHLLPERNVDLARFLVGSEGTLSVLTEATVRLVRDPAVRVMIVLGYPDITLAGDATPAVLTHQPTACEGFDQRLLDVLHSRGGTSPPLPPGPAWLFTEVSGEDRGEVLARAEAMVDDAGLGAHSSLIVTDAAQAAALWRIRADGAGLAGRSPAGKPAWPGWEDAAVPPTSLGAYLRDFDELVVAHGLSSAPYGHFGDGCMHVRLDVPLDAPDGPTQLREFVVDAAKLVATYGGSLSGEHGDGRARSELLPLMYSPEVIDLFAAAKHACDPDNLLNPGVLVDPAPLDADLRFPARRTPTPLAFSWTADGGDFSQAVHRCTGVGKCRADNTASGGVMCPSYLATREEKDSTRGRARVLQEMLNGSVVTGGWRAPEVHDALDLCLSCKGCASDCPTGIDMASYKAEVLHQSYKGRLRPIAHYVLGQLPRWVRAGARAPKVANALLRAGDRMPFAKSAVGVDARRSIPQVAADPFRSWAREHGLHPYDAARATGDEVVLLVDTFTDNFSPAVGAAMVAVLRDAGFTPVLPTTAGCCGLTWISTGQLDGARRQLERTLAGLAPAANAGVPIVGIEPSCTAVLRHDAAELVPTDDARAVRDATVTLAELLARTPGWSPPSLDGVRIIAQPHCHHHAVMSWAADAALLERAGAQVQRLGGCCGLAGNFGVEKGHYDVSVAIAEQQLLPAVRAARPGDVVLADGFSCRTQLDDLLGALPGGESRGMHLAQLLAAKL